MCSAVRPESSSAERASTLAPAAIDAMCSRDPCIAIVRNAVDAFGHAVTGAGADGGWTESGQPSATRREKAEEKSRKKAAWSSA